MKKTLVTFSLSTMFIFRRKYSTLFQLCETSKRVQLSSREFAENELKPVAELHDKLAKFPQKHIELLAQKGLLGAVINKEYGGRGYDLVTFSLLIEELSRCCASTGIVVSIHNCLYADLIQSYGTSDQIKDFLIPFANEHIGVFALSEYDAGSDAASLTTVARKEGDYYILNGRKAWVTSGKEGSAGVIFAYTDKTKGHRGISAFLVPFETLGVHLGHREEKLGIRASSTCDIILNNVKLPSNYLIGGIGNGFEIAMRQLQLGRIGVAAQAIGIGRAAFELALKYSYNRTVFNERLCTKQLVKEKLAKMATDLESARLLLLKAAALRERNEDFRMLSSMAKYMASLCATSNSHKCVQILGAKGFVNGEAERYYRDSRITQIYGGATDIQKLVIADLILEENELD